MSQQEQQEQLVQNQEQQEQQESKEQQEEEKEESQIELKEDENKNENESEQQKEKKKKKRNKNKNKKKKEKQGQEPQSQQEFIEKLNKQFEQSNILNKQPKFTKLDKNIKQVENKIVELEHLAQEVANRQFTRFEQMEPLETITSEGKVSSHMGGKTRKLINDLEKQKLLLEERITMAQQMMQSEKMAGVKELLQITIDNLQDDILKGKQLKEIIINSF